MRTFVIKSFPLSACRGEPRPRAGTHPASNGADLYGRLRKRAYQALTALKVLPGQLTYWRVLQRAKDAGIISSPFHILKPRPISGKHLGRYISASFTTSDRLAVLRRTYEVLSDLEHRSMHVSLSQQHRIWRSRESGLDLEVWIGPPTFAPMEGEIALVFMSEQRAIYTMTFAIAPGVLVGVCETDAILVGGLQGAPNSRAALRDASRAIGDIAPQDVLILAIKALADILDIPIIAGVGSVLHVSQDANGTRQDFDYDELWTRKGATRTCKGFFVMSSRAAYSAPVGGTAAHRARTKRKRQAKMRIQEEIGANLCACFAEEPRVPFTQHRLDGQLVGGFG